MSFEKQNLEKEQSYTSTGEKLLHHEDAITDLKNKKNHPIVLHIMPTEACNLKCVFCSVAQRGEEGKLYPDLRMDQIKYVVGVLKKKGLKAVILSGGGEPVIYPEINELIEYLYQNGLEIGLITNGVLLKEKIKKNNIDKLTWVRVSINSLDYLEKIELPEFNSEKTTFGMSYIWNPLSEKKFEIVKNEIKKIRETNKVEYIRLLPDCNLDDDNLEEGHKKLHKLAEDLGEPYFHQYKIHQQPEECHLGRVHPVLYTDGMIYPCDSVVLNSPKDDKRFHQGYSLCKWDEVEEFFNKEIKDSLIDTKKCPYCVFARQNKLLTEIIYTKQEIKAPEEELKHINFI
jgi:MoaA/NifB/PqqE/SkfB family radical SAM enzyme